MGFSTITFPFLVNKLGDYIKVLQAVRNDRAIPGLEHQWDICIQTEMNETISDISVTLLSPQGECLRKFQHCSTSMMSMFPTFSEFLNHKIREKNQKKHKHYFTKIYFPHFGISIDRICLDIPFQYKDMAVLMKFYCDRDFGSVSALP